MSGYDCISAGFRGLALTGSRRRKQQRNKDKEENENKAQHPEPISPANIGASENRYGVFSAAAVTRPGPRGQARMTSQRPSSQNPRQRRIPAALLDRVELRKSDGGGTGHEMYCDSVRKVIEVPISW